GRGTGAKLWVVMEMWFARMIAPALIVIVIIGCTLASACAFATLITPPDEPDDEAVAGWSPGGAPARAAVPPIPSNFSVTDGDEPGWVSNTRVCSPMPGPGRSTPWTAKTCGPPLS